MIWEWIKIASPLATSLSTYRREQFAGDLTAGLIVAIMLVPQAMAYAMLAGLPPQVGLYASIAPLILYALFGSSNALAVGPVAMISLLVVTGLSEHAKPGSPEFIQLCLLLALLAGILQLLMAGLRLGFLVNFISHPVLIGFTSASAIVIGFSQVKHLLGISVKSSDYPYQLIIDTLAGARGFKIITVVIGLTSIVVLVFFAFGLSPLLQKMRVKKSVASTVSRIGPLVAVVVASLFVFSIATGDSASIAIVGEIPKGLPGITFPDVSLATMTSLFPLALVISLVGYMESISVAKAMAARKREKVNANRELFALGLADVGSALTGGYPVTGGFSRSMVSFSAGVCTPLASMMTAVIVAVSVLFLTPLFFYIPNAVLAAIIIVAVAPLVDFKTPIKLWRYSRADAVALLVTFGAVLALGIDTGILVGILTTVVALMWKMSRPHVAEVGRVGDTEHFRNVLRHDVQLTEGVLALRIDESLNFANAPFLESFVIEQVSDRPDIRNVLLISSGINDVDATGLEVLETVRRELAAIGIGFYMSDVKGPVTDRFKLAGVEQTFLENHIFLSAAEAVTKLVCQTEATGDPESVSSDNSATNRR